MASLKSGSGRLLRECGLWGRRFEDFNVGDSFTTLGRTVTETDLILYSGLVGETSFMHLNEERAKKTVYGKRVFQGLLTFALSEGLMQQTGLFDSIEEAQFVELRDMKIIRAVVPGDTITVKFEVTNKEKSKKRSYGIMTLKRIVANQKEEVVLTAETLHLKKMAH